MKRILFILILVILLSITPKAGANSYPNRLTADAPFALNINYKPVAVFGEIHAGAEFKIAGVYGDYTKVQFRKLPTIYVYVLTSELVYSPIHPPIPPR